MRFVDILLWGTGGPLMYAALGLAVLAAAFFWTCREWAQGIHEVPLNYIAEPRYRTPMPLSYYQEGTAPIYAASAYTSTQIISPGRWRP